MEPDHYEPPVPLAVALSFLVGVGVAVQAFCNGRLAKELGSIEIAGLANMVTGGGAAARADRGRRRGAAGPAPGGARGRSCGGGCSSAASPAR
jgi:hypothetical protein